MPPLRVATGQNTRRTNLPKSLLLGLTAQGEKALQCCTASNLLWSLPLVKRRDLNTGTTAKTLNLSKGCEPLHNRTCLGISSKGFSIAISVVWMNVNRDYIKLAGTVLNKGCNCPPFDQFNFFNNGPARGEENSNSSGVGTSIEGNCRWLDNPHPRNTLIQCLRFMALPLSLLDANRSRLEEPPTPSKPVICRRGGGPTAQVPREEHFHPCRQSTIVNQALVTDEHLDSFELPFRRVALPREIYRHLFVKAGGPASALDVWLRCRGQDRWRGLGSALLRLSAPSKRCSSFSLEMPFITVSSTVVPSILFVFVTSVSSRISWIWDRVGMMFPFLTLLMLLVFPSMTLTWYCCTPLLINGSFSFNLCSEKDGVANPTDGFAPQYTHEKDRPHQHTVSQQVDQPDQQWNHQGS